MFNERKICNLIKNELLAGNRLGEVIYNAFCAIRFEGDGFNMEEIRRYFESLQNNETELRRNRSDLPEGHKHLLELIYGEFQKAQRATEARTCRAKRCKMKFLSERFAIDVKEESEELTSLVLFDAFHEQLREIQIDGDLPTLCSYDYKLGVINSEYFLLIDIGACCEEGQFDLYLLKLNLAEFKCSVLDKKSVNGYYNTLYTDSLNSDNFVLDLSSWPTRYFALCQIAEERLKIGQSLMVPDFNFYSSTVKVEGNKVLVLANGTDRNYELKLIYCEFLFQATKIHGQKVCDVERDEGIQILDIHYTDFVWLDRNCFGIAQINYDTPYLLRFDLDIHKLTKINHPGVLDILVEDLFIDHSNEVLCVCTKNGYSNQHIMRRIPSRRPDNLLNLTLTVVNKEAFFWSQSTYDDFIHKMPPNLKPFAV